jgi:aldehyde:ferredoxin oxidoreductase
MPYGYMGKILRADLSSGSLKEEELNQTWADKYMGGTGLASRYLHQMITPQTQAFDPENTIIFMTGPLAGTRSLTSGRHQVVGISPLSGLIGESDSGGTWGQELKRAGYDGVVITGKAEQPRYLYISHGQAELRDASHLWGLDTYDLDPVIKDETDPKSVVACIGTAAEKGVLVSNVMNDGTEGRAAGRCGFGAVLGDKRLKALVVRGTDQVEQAHPETLKEIIKQYAPLVADHLKDMRKFGTARMVQASEHVGSMPLQNFKYPHRWEAGAERISGPAFAEKVIIKPYFCASCVIGCGNTVQVKDGPYKTVRGGGPEYETINLFGGNLLNSNLESLCLANELCNRYGIDTIDTGNLVGVAMEAYERGLITQADTGGVALEWGDADAIIECIRMIGEKRHIGELLGRGMKAVAQEFNDAEGEFVIHVKGLSMPAHDPRAYNGLACSYATANRGAHHTAGMTHAYEHRMKVPEIGHEPMGRFVVEGKGKLAALTQNIMNVLDSVKSCKFAQNGGWTIGPVTQAYNAVTGREHSIQDMIRNGERSFNLKRLINVDRGVSRAQDRLPKRLMTLKKEAEGYTPNLPPLDVMLDEYYQARGWSNDGIPLEATIERLEVFE